MVQRARAFMSSFLYFTNIRLGPNMGEAQCQVVGYILPGLLQPPNWFPCFYPHFLPSSSQKEPVKKAIFLPFNGSHLMQNKPLKSSKRFTRLYTVGSIPSLTSSPFTFPLAYSALATRGLHDIPQNMPPQDLCTCCSWCCLEPSPRYLHGPCFTSLR